MRNNPIEKNFPSITYIANNWPNTKHHLRKFVMSNSKKPDFFKLCFSCLKELNVHKLNNHKKTLEELVKICSQNVNYNTYHDPHHFKSVIVIACLLAKLINLNQSDRILLVIIALTHDMNHQGRRIIAKPYYQEDRSSSDLEKIWFKRILNLKKWKRIQRIFRSTYFPIKPDNVVDDLEKIILDADVLGSLMFGMESGMKLAGRLKHEIRFKENTKKLFEGFLNLLENKTLYLDSSKKSC